MAILKSNQRPTMNLCKGAQPLSATTASKEHILEDAEIAGFKRLVEMAIFLNACVDHFNLAHQGTKFSTRPHPSPFSNVLPYHRVHPFLVGNPKTSHFKPPSSTMARPRSSQLPPNTAPETNHPRRQNKILHPRTKLAALWWHNSRMGFRSGI